MKVGIFECGYMSERLQDDQFTNYPDMLIQAFRNISLEPEFVIYDAPRSRFPADINECNAYITTGSLHSVNDDLPWIRELEDFIRQCWKRQKKVAGICFGHQLLAKSLGGTVAKNETGIKFGVIENRLLQHKAWTKPHQLKFNMVIHHEDRVVTMPEGAVLLASNEHCENFMFQSGDHFIGIQGHPEFDNDFSRRLIAIESKHIPDNRVKAGYDSLSITPDNSVVMQWIANFLAININD